MTDQAKPCDGSDDPRQRCNTHHGTSRPWIFGGNECCCGDSWIDQHNICSGGAAHGHLVSVSDRIDAFLADADPGQAAWQETFVDAIVEHVITPEIGKYKTVATINAKLMFAGEAEIKRLQGLLNIADAKRDQLRCPSCDHSPGIHLPQGCWYTVDRGRPDRDLVCPCAVARATFDQAGETA